MSEEREAYRAEPAKYQVFVDFENVPTVDLGLISGHPVQVTLLIGKNQKRLDTSFSIQLHKFSKQVHPVRVDASGHNALDLILSYYLGRAAQQAPRAQYFIVSKDKDFDPLIAHLKSNGIQVSRHDGFGTLPFLTPPKKSSPPKSVAAPKPATQKPIENRRDKLIARFRNPANRNRPATRKALLAYLKTALGKDASEVGVEDFIRELQAEKVLTIELRDKVRYP